MEDRDVVALDDPVGESLRGPHAHLARRVGRAVTYLPGVATFSSVSADADAAEWAELAQLLGGPDQFADMFSCPASPPPGWDPVFVLEGRQMIWPGARRAGEPGELGAESDGKVVELDPESVPEVLALVERTQPGPFWPRTHELGTYLGIRENGALVAMAGERLKPPGWTEISAVCTAPEARGRGYAAHLVSELVTRVMSRGVRPFLHVAEKNTAAIALYERLGFETRKHVTFRGFRTP
ncbi:GNAT family N-acetyltransferase [Streptomyces sp. NPDC046465]|uniref:GNAT family N-acetyltransferase n=1 Tax=Streptomyces sp. NPDC046465 TaxID=3155810 RepID=UPI0033C65109